MKQTRSLFKAMALLCFAFMATQATAALISKFDLPGLVTNADKVFRGTVVDLQPGEIEAGGATFPTVTYTISVDETIKGQFGGAKTIEIRMLGDVKEQPEQEGVYRKLSAYDINPKLKIGGTYVLFTTQPSAIGLSTTVGLNQGLFRVFTDANGREMTSNDMDNAGLSAGPVGYGDLLAAIKSNLN